MCKDLGILTKCRNLLETFGAENYTLGNIAAVCAKNKKLCTTNEIMAVPLEVWNAFKDDAIFKVEDCFHNLSASVQEDENSFTSGVYMKYFQWKEAPGIRGSCSCKDVTYLGDIYGEYLRSQPAASDAEMDEWFHLIFKDHCNNARRTRLDLQVLKLASTAVLKESPLKNYTLDFLIKFTKKTHLLLIWEDNKEKVPILKVLRQFMYPPGRPYQEDKPMMTFDEAAECAKVFAQLTLDDSSSTDLTKTFGRFSLNDSSRHGALVLEIVKFILTKKNEEKIFNQKTEKSFIKNIIDIIVNIYPIYEKTVEASGIAN